MRIYHAIGEFRLYKNQYEKVLEILEKEMQDSPYDLVVTDCTDDSYYVSIVETMSKCTGNCSTKNNADHERMNEIVDYILSTPILRDMYENFLDTESLKFDYFRGTIDRDHVASKAHLIFDRVITSFIDSN